MYALETLATMENAHMKNPKLFICDGSGMGPVVWEQIIFASTPRGKNNFF